MNLQKWTYQELGIVGRLTTASKKVEKYGEA